jgi:hypothetical protein
MAARKKGREKRAAANDEGTGLVRVKLTDDQWRERSADLASFEKKLEDTESKKAAAAAKYNSEIKLIKEKISTLADEVDTREANVDAQQAMNFGGTAGRRAGAANEHTRREKAGGKAAAAGDDEAEDADEPEAVEGAA